MKALNKLLKPLTLGLVGFVASITPAMAIFPDINAETTMYYDAIVYLEGKDTVVGFSDGTFRPEANISRGEFTKIIVETRFSDAQIAACNEQVFPDVTTTNPHYRYICIAHNNNILHGYSNGQFKPDLNIMADQAGKIIVNSYAINFGQTAQTDLALYTEQLKSRDAWPNSVDGNKDLLKRNEMAQIIYRIEVKNTFQTTSELASFNTAESALVTSGLGVLLKGETAYTVFLPVNDAFTKLDQPTWNSLLTDTTKVNDLKNLLLQHVIKGKYTLDKLRTMDNQTIETEGGVNLLIDVNTDNVVIQDQNGKRAQIIGNGVETSNGVVFEIDSVLNIADK